MLDNTIVAAQANGATIVLPGTVYNYGPSAFPTLHEDSLQQPSPQGCHPCGDGAASAAGQQPELPSDRGARGDFFGPKPGNSWFSQGMLKPGQPVKSISMPNAPGVGHQWSYLPDVARAMVELVQRRDTLPPLPPSTWQAIGTPTAPSWPLRSAAWSSSAAESSPK
jgi:nucleoside-diphosphate-sugar epimerase